MIVTDRGDEELERDGLAYQDDRSFPWSPTVLDRMVECAVPVYAQHRVRDPRPGAPHTSRVWVPRWAPGLVAVLYGRLEVSEISRAVRDCLFSPDPEARALSLGSVSMLGDVAEAVGMLDARQAELCAGAQGPWPPPTKPPGARARRRLRRGLL